MIELKEYIKKNQYKKIGLARFYRNASDKYEKAKNAGSLDVFYTKKFLLDECNINADVVKISSSTDFSKYDLLIFQPYTFIMFGGIWEGHTVDFIFDYVKHFQGETMIVYNDPNVTWSNPLKILSEKNKVVRNGKIEEEQFDHSLIKQFELKKTIGCFIGKDFQQFKLLAKTVSSTFWPSTHIKINLSEYIHSNILQKNNTIEVNPKSKIYDVVYYGSNRKGQRNKQIKFLQKNTSLALRWIGYDPKFPNTTWTKKVKYDSLEPLVAECLTSLIVGDVAHNDNIIIYRFFESAAFNIVNLIHNNFDPNMKLYKSKELQDNCYVNSLEDIENIVAKLKGSKSFYNNILQLQKQEIINIANSW